MRAVLRLVLRNAEEVVAGAALVMVVALILYGIFNRYVLQLSSVWAPELASLIFTWAVFLGASAAWKRKMHISIDVVVSRLGPKVQAPVRILTDVIVIVFLAYATYLAISITISSHVRLSPVLRVPFTYVYAGAALAFASMFLRELVRTARAMSPPSSAREA